MSDTASKPQAVAGTGGQSARLELGTVKASVPRWSVRTGFSAPQSGVEWRSPRRNSTCPTASLVDASESALPSASTHLHLKWRLEYLTAE